MTTATTTEPTATALNLATHNGRVTVHNPATGQHRTFQIRTQPTDAKFAPGERIVSILAGPDNEEDYQGFGFVKTLPADPTADPSSPAGRPAAKITLWRKNSTPVFEAYARILCNPEHYEAHHGLTYLAESRCRRCNRTLTTPESILNGIGPECAKKA